MEKILNITSIQIQPAFLLRSARLIATVMPLAYLSVPRPGPPPHHNISLDCMRSRQWRKWRRGFKWGIFLAEIEDVNIGLRSNWVLRLSNPFKSWQLTAISVFSFGLSTQLLKRRNLHLDKGEISFSNFIGEIFAPVMHGQGIFLRKVRQPKIRQAAIGSLYP